MIGGRAWEKLNEAAREQRRAEKAARRAAFDRKKRREDLEDAGFRPISPRHYESWGSE